MTNESMLRLVGRLDSFCEGTTADSYQRSAPVRVLRCAACAWDLSNVPATGAGPPLRATHLTDRGNYLVGMGGLVFQSRS
jgi:hypothetical protein